MWLCGYVIVWAMCLQIHMSPVMFPVILPPSLPVQVMPHATSNFESNYFSSCKLQVGMS